MKQLRYELQVGSSGFALIPLLPALHSGVVIGDVVVVVVHIVVVVVVVVGAFVVEVVIGLAEGMMGQSAQ